MSNSRQLTRDLIPDNMNCGCKPPPTPVGGYSLSVFTDMMFQVAKNNGYLGTKNDFENDFIASLNGASGSANGVIIQRGSVNDFPSIGVESGIYVDTSTQKIYFWKDGRYYTVTADVQENTILDGGPA